MAAEAEAEQRKHDATLCASADKGDEPGVRAALEAGASPSAVDQGVPAAAGAAESKHWGVVRILAEAGADLGATTPSGFTVLFMAAQEGAPTETVRLLLDRSADPNTRAENGFTAVCIAAEMGHGDIIRLLLERKADPELAVHETGGTPLITAAEKDRPDAVHALLEGGAAVDAQDKEGGTALFMAAQQGATEPLRLLLAGGAAVDLAMHNGQTPLWIAACGRLQAVQLLLEAGATVDAAPTEGDFVGQTPLSASVDLALPLVAQALLCARADPNAAADDGMTSLRLACRDKQLQPGVALLLIRCGSDAEAFPPQPADKMSGPNYTLKCGERTGEMIQPSATSVYQAMDAIGEYGLSHTLQDVAEEVKHRPALVQATLAVLSYPHAMRPFQAVRSADIDQVRAWLSMLERPSDVDQQMELYTYTAFSLACALGLVDIVTLLLEHERDGHRVDTLVPNYQGLSGWDLAKDLARHSSSPEDKERFVAIEDLLESHAERHGKLRLEKERNRSRPVESAPVERAEIDFGRLGFWPAHGNEEGGQYIVWVKRSEGAFGFVWMVTGIWPELRDSSGKPHSVAIAKSTKLAEVPDADDDTAKSQRETADAELKALAAETRTLQKVQHPNIVTTFGFTYGKAKGSTQPGYMLLLELCHCDLGALIYPKKGSEEVGKLDSALMMKIAREMADALAYLHSRAIKHLDMKPGNVLLALEDDGGSYSVRIADFGMDDEEEEEQGDDEEEDTPYGTWEYMAPECLKRKFGRPVFASDVFSYAIILWELWARRRVYTGFLNLEDNIDKAHLKETGESRVDVKLVASRMAADQRPELPGDCPALWALLMRACWVAEHTRRPTFPQVLAVLAKMAAVPTWAETPDAAAEEGVPTESDPEPETAPETEAEARPLAGWLTNLGLQEHLSLIEGYVSGSSQMADLLGMLVAEREDEEEEDLKDLVGEMELDEEAAAAFRAAIGAIVLPKKDEPKAEPEPEPELELEPEPEPEPKPNPWLELLASLGLAADPNLAEAGKTEDDETLQLRVDFLEAELDGAKMAAFNRLVRKKDEEKDAALARQAAEKDEEKEAALAALRAELTKD